LASSPEKIPARKIPRPENTTIPRMHKPVIIRRDESAFALFSLVKSVITTAKVWSLSGNPVLIFQSLVFKFEFLMEFCKTDFNMSNSSILEILLATPNSELIVAEYHKKITE